jgi:hypothetical protein
MESVQRSLNDYWKAANPESNASLSHTKNKGKSYFDFSSTSTSPITGTSPLSDMDIPNQIFGELEEKTTSPMDGRRCADGKRLKVHILRLLFSSEQSYRLRHIFLRV